MTAVLYVDSIGLRTKFFLKTSLKLKKNALSTKYRPNRVGCWFLNDQLLLPFHSLKYTTTNSFKFCLASSSCLKSCIALQHTSYLINLFTIHLFVTLAISRYKYLPAFLFAFFCLKYFVLINFSHSLFRIPMVFKFHKIYRSLWLRVFII